MKLSTSLAIIGLAAASAGCVAGSSSSGSSNHALNRRSSSASHRSLARKVRSALGGGTEEDEDALSKRGITTSTVHGQATVSFGPGQDELGSQVVGRS